MPAQRLPIPRTGYLFESRTDRPKLLRKSTHVGLVVPPDWLFRSHEGQKESGTMGSFARTAGAWKRTLLFAVGALLVMAAPASAGKPVQTIGGGNALMTTINYT